MSTYVTELVVSLSTQSLAQHTISTGQKMQHAQLREGFNTQPPAVLQLGSIRADTQTCFHVWLHMTSMPDPADIALMFPPTLSRKKSKGAWLVCLIKPGMPDSNAALC